MLALPRLPAPSSLRTAVARQRRSLTLLLLSDLDYANDLAEEHRCPLSTAAHSTAPRDGAEPVCGGRQRCCGGAGLMFRWRPVTRLAPRRCCDPTILRGCRLFVVTGGLKRELQGVFTVAEQ